MADPFVLLKQDHREAEALLEQLVESKNPGPRRGSAVAKLTAALALHMDVEERFVYPIVAEENGSEPVGEANTEHTLKLQREELDQLADESTAAKQRTKQPA
jgi:hypothetical protein